MAECNCGWLRQGGHDLRVMGLNLNAASCTFTYKGQPFSYGGGGCKGMEHGHDSATPPIHAVHDSATPPIHAVHDFVISI